MKKNSLFILLITIAGLSYLILNWPSGSNYCRLDKCGVYFWGSHGHDGIWHMAIAETAFNQWPFAMPTFAGARLTGYNYLYDLFLFFLNKIGIPPITAYFKLVPAAWFVIYTYLLIKLAQKIKRSRSFVWLFLFYTYFTGSFSYFFTLIKDKTVWGSSGLLAQLVQHTLLNHQFALSLLPLLYVLIKMKEKTLSLKTVISAATGIFIVTGIKFYGGVIMLVLVSSYIILIQAKKNIVRAASYVVITGLFFAVSLWFFYDPFSAVKSGAVFTWSPFAFIHSITEDPSLFYLNKLTTARYAYHSTGQWWKLIPIEFINLGLFLFFYSGVRFFGLVYAGIRLWRKKIDPFETAILITIIVSLLLTALFVQKGEWTNIVQFFYYGVFLSTIYLAQLSYELIKTRKIGRFIIVIIFMALSIPATIDVFVLYARFPGTAYLPAGEREALAKLRTMPGGIVFSPLYKQDEFHRQQIIGLKEQGGILPLYAWEDTAYVTAFSGKKQYLADLWMERITGIDYQQRLNKIKNNDCSIFKEIDYIYFNNEYRISRSLFDCPYRFTMVYGNRTASIYSVTK